MSKYVIVLDPGTDAERVVSEHSSYTKACDYLDRKFSNSGVSYDIMKRQSNGELTTEL